MAKVKIPLVMKNGEKAKNMETLRENFDIESIVGYFLDGKLSKWLNDRYYEEEAEAVAQLEAIDPQLTNKLCEIFGVEFKSDSEIDPKEIIKQKERLAHLKQLTDEKEILQNVQYVAFNQEELEELYDSGAEKIYLCEGNFKISKSKQELEYILIGEPIVEGLEEASYENIDDIAPQIIEFKSLQEKKTIENIEGNVIIFDSYNISFWCYYAVITNIPMDLSAYKRKWLLGYTARYLVCSAVYYFNKEILIVDRNNGIVRSFRIEEDYCVYDSSGADFVNGTDKYILIRAKNVYLYDIENDNVKVVEYDFSKCVSWKEKSAIYCNEKIKVINLETGEIEHTISSPIMYRQDTMLLTDTGLYYAFSSDWSPQRNATLYYYEYSSKSIRLLFELPAGNKKISIPFIGSYGGNNYFVIQNENEIASYCIDFSVYEISASGEITQIYSEAKIDIDKIDYQLPRIIFSEKSGSIFMDGRHISTTKIFVFDVLTHKKRLLVDGALEGSYIKWGKTEFKLAIANNYLHYKCAEDNGKELSAIPYHICISDPNSTPERISG